MTAKVPRARRHPRRLLVSYRPKGADKALGGFTTDISTSGMFVATGRVLPVGTRVVAEVRYQDESFVVEAEVTRVLRQPHELRGIYSQGFGLRFLPVAALVQELVGGAEARDRAAGEQPSPSTAAYRVAFADAGQFLRVYQRDLQTGGLYVRTEQPADLGERVTIELRPPSAEPVRFEAKVVHRSAPEGGDGTPNLLAGIGVELADREAVLTALAPAVEHCRRAAPVSEHNPGPRDAS